MDETKTMNEMLTLERLQEMVNKGERARIVWELLMDVVGCTYEDGTNQIMKNLGDIQKDHMRAVAEMGKFIGINHTIQKKAKKAKKTVEGHPSKDRKNYMEGNVDGDVSTSN